MSDYEYDDDDEPYEEFDYGDEDEDENDYDQEKVEQEYTYERAVFDRVQFRSSDEFFDDHTLTSYDINEADLETLHDKVYGRFFNNQEKFKVLFQIYYRRWKEIYNFQENDYVKMSSKIDTLPYVNFKNAICFILSYYITQDSNTINREKLKLNQKFLKENFIELEDILRYCRLWTIKN